MYFCAFQLTLKLPEKAELQYTFIRWSGKRTWEEVDSKMLRCDGAVMRTTLNIDDDVLSVARALAQRKKVSLGSAVSELVRRGFRNGGRIVAKRDDIPFFPLDPNAELFTSEDVYRALM